MLARQLQAVTRMHNPPHPGETLKDTVVRSDGGLSVTEFVRRLGVSRVALSEGDRQSTGGDRNEVSANLRGKAIHEHSGGTR